MVVSAESWEVHGEEEEFNGSEICYDDFYVPSICFVMSRRELLAGNTVLKKKCL